MYLHKISIKWKAQYKSQYEGSSRVTQWKMNLVLSFWLIKLKQDVHILLNPVMLLFVKQLFIHNLKKCPKKGHSKKYSCMPSITTLCAAGLRENFFWVLSCNPHNPKPDMGNKHWKVMFFIPGQENVSEIIIDSRQNEALQCHWTKCITF